MPLTKRSSGRLSSAANDHAHGVSHHRVVEARQLPCAQMAGDNQHALAARLGCQVMVQALGAYPVARVLRGVAGQAAKLHKLPAKMAEDPAYDAPALRRREFRQSQFQIAHADAAQPSQPSVRCPGQQAGRHARQHARHASQGARHGQNQPILKLLPHR